MILTGALTFVERGRVYAGSAKEVLQCSYRLATVRMKKNPTENMALRRGRYSQFRCEPVPLRWLPQFAITSAASTPLVLEPPMHNRTTRGHFSRQRKSPVRYSQPYTGT